MKQKLIKIGSSTGVTLPAKQLELLGFSVGDNVAVTFDEATRSFHVKPDVTEESGQVDSELINWARDFNNRYGEALDELRDK